MYLFKFKLTYSVALVSGVEPENSSLTYNTQCSSQQVPSLMPITHLPQPPPTSLPATLSSLCLRVSYGLGRLGGAVG